MGFKIKKYSKCGRYVLVNLGFFFRKVKGFLLVII